MTVLRKLLNGTSVLLVSFTEAAAPLKQVEKRITAGVTIDPAVMGTWFWASDRELQFTNGRARVLRVIDDHGRSAERDVQVQFSR